MWVNTDNDITRNLRYGGIRMGLSEVDLAQRASCRYAIVVVEGDAVFIGDRMLGHKLYLGPEKPLSRPDFRRYVISLNSDLDNLSAQDFLEKYGLKG